jgi:hypothetical protein
LQEVHRLPREVLRKRDRHRTSTEFRLGVIRRVHELCKRPSHIQNRCIQTQGTILYQIIKQIFNCSFPDDHFVIKRRRHIYMCCYDSRLKISASKTRYIGLQEQNSNAIKICFGDSKNVSKWEYFGWVIPHEHGQM